MLFASQHTECKRQLVPHQLKTLTLRHLSQPKFVQFIQLVGGEKTQFYPHQVFIYFHFPLLLSLVNTLQSHSTQLVTKLLLLFRISSAAIT